MPSHIIITIFNFQFCQFFIMNGEKQSVNWSSWMNEIYLKNVRSTCTELSPYFFGCFSIFTSVTETRSCMQLSARVKAWALTILWYGPRTKLNKICCIIYVTMCSFDWWWQFTRKMYTRGGQQNIPSNSKRSQQQNSIIQMIVTRAKFQTKI